MLRKEAWGFGARLADHLRIRLRSLAKLYRTVPGEKKNFMGLGLNFGS